MRKSFDWLHAVVQEHLELHAFAGHQSIFIGGLHAQLLSRSEAGQAVAYSLQN